MDDWDPEFVARLATARRVIRFDSLGIGESSGETPNSVRGMAEVVPLLLDALDRHAVDALLITSQAQVDNLFAVASDNQRTVDVSRVAIGALRS